MKHALGQSGIAEVFTTSDRQLRWVYVANNGRVPQEMLASISAFDALMSEIKVQVPKTERDIAYTQLGKALFHSLDSSSPEDHIERYMPVRNFISDCAIRASRLQYVLAFLGSAFLLGAPCAIAAWVIGPNHRADPFLWAASCGVAGSVMSVLSRSGDLKLDPRSHRPFLILQGACRPLLGALFGVFITQACLGDILLSFAKNIPLALLAMATVAGFSERFIPEIMTRLEGSP